MLLLLSNHVYPWPSADSMLWCHVGLYVYGVCEKERGREISKQGIGILRTLCDTKSCLN